jgi:carboxymethylenebutenolidase
VTDEISTSSIRIIGSGGDDIEAYLARPTAQDHKRGGVVLIHHLPGFDRWSKEVARRFAVDGYDVLAPNLYSREAPGADPDDAAAKVRAMGGVPDERLVGDVAGAVAWLRSQPTSNGKVAVIGHCSGGRHAVLAGCNLDLDAVVDCYGAFVIRSAPPEMGLRMEGLEDQLVNLSAPLLGLFGTDDKAPSPDDVATLDRLLTEYGKPHEFHSWDDAGHAFFATDRPAYRQLAAVEGYARIADFFSRTIG